MEEHENVQKHTQGHETQPTKKCISYMRDFLESEVEFTWPLELGDCSGNHCNFKPEINHVPLLWKEKISDRKASIDMYETHPEYNYTFNKPFVVKTIRESSSKRARDEAANEVNTMRDLRHPHVAALLATFMFQERLNILIFPAACCDLHRFMKRTSKDLEYTRSQRPSLEAYSQSSGHSDDTATLDSTTSGSQVWQGPEQAKSGKLGKTHQRNENIALPLKLSFQQKSNTLRGFFVCLSEALKYLHESDVRHKDIKPENILIDKSGSVILTDFGISRRFAKGRSHVTNNEWKFTRKYACPEIMKGKRVPRDDPSDVFSLGCVFLEMATLLLGRNLNNFSEHYTTAINDSAKEEAYYCNLPKVYSWIDYLKQSQASRPVPLEPLLNARVERQDFGSDLDGRMIGALTHIRRMLDENPLKRPRSQNLWECFQHVSLEKCQDCDPRHKERWQPSRKQQQNSKTGLNHRRSLVIKEAASQPIESPENGDVNSSFLSAFDIPTQPTSRAQRFSTASSIQRMSQSVPTLYKVPSPSQSSRTINIHESTKLTLRPASPTHQRPIDRAANARPSRSLSPRKRGVQPSLKNDSPSIAEIKHTPNSISFVENPPNHINPILENSVIATDEALVGIPGSIVANAVSKPQDSRLIRISSPATVHAGNQDSESTVQDVMPGPPQEPSPQTHVIVYDFDLRWAYSILFARLQGLLNLLTHPVPALKKD